MHDCYQTLPPRSIYLETFFVGLLMIAVSTKIHFANFGLPVSFVKSSTTLSSMEHGFSKTFGGSTHVKKMMLIETGFVR